MDRRVEFLEDFPVSMKKNGGIGTQSVVNTVDKYGGMVKFTQVKDQFICQIILPQIAR